MTDNDSKILQQMFLPPAWLNLLKMALQLTTDTPLALQLKPCHIIIICFNVALFETAIMPLLVSHLSW